jgi:GT2 family glycosyltransferase
MSIGSAPNLDGHVHLSRWPAVAVAAMYDGVARLVLHWWQNLACPPPRRLILLRRAFLLIWWTLTLQLPRHAVYWLRARQARRAARNAPGLLRAELLVPPAEDIRIQSAEWPIVSVIIPTYGQVPCTLRCLAAIAADPPAAPIEVIVIDDASHDPEVARLASVKGIRLIRQTRNRGFLHTCNEAAKRAAGRHLLFLNNDTQPLPGWLDAMLALLRARPDAGAVGARLLYPNGRLQEAGGIIWNDASGWNFGRGDEPNKPEYAYVREVDYCSGAALLVRAALFARLGGFDPRYAPAYFEDSDLAFRLRAAGFKTLYQPLAEVIHIEGASHGTDTTRGVKACQRINRDTFVARWADILTREHVAPGTQILRARDRAYTRPVVLVIDYRVPEPDRDAGSCTMIAFVQALLDAGAVVKFWSDCSAPQPGYDTALQQMGVEVRRGGWAEFIPWIAVNGAALDHVLLSRPEVAERYLLPVRRCSRARVAFYGHDLHHDRLGQLAAQTGHPATALAARRMLRLERRVWRRVDAVLYPSREEADCVAALEPGACVHVVQPYAFAQVAPPRPATRSQTVLFVAGFAHLPNEDAACWLARAVMPLVRRYEPSAHLAIVGSRPTARVRALAGPEVTVAADVSDAELQSWYARARVAVVPLRQGAGVKRKVVEALREGLPLVTTAVGAQGLPGLYAVASVCITAETIAEAVSALLRDDVLWRARSEAGTAYVRTRFSPEGLRSSLLRALALPDRLLPAVPAQHREPLFQVGDQVRHVLQADMQPHQGAGEAGARRARDEAGGRQRQALEATPGRADAEQRERLDESVGALD